MIEVPESRQLPLEFEDGSHMSCPACQPLEANP
jgi:hypothetical protein